MQKQPLEMVYKKAVLKNFTIFNGKQLCRSFFLIKLQAQFLRILILKNICVWAASNYDSLAMCFSRKFTMLSRRNQLFFVG